MDSFFGILGVVPLNSNILWMEERSVTLIRLGDIDANPVC